MVCEYMKLMVCGHRSFISKSKSKENVPSRKKMGGIYYFFM